MKTTIIEINGIVQGVGFRPFVYNLAIKNALNGFVRNDENGVYIVLQGKSFAIKNFLKEIKTNPPPLSNIVNLNFYDITTDKKYFDFSITNSKSLSLKTTLISPDISICSDCLEDISNKNNFRYNYALTNCTNCGPRYTIIKTIPYDRINTSMHSFELCNKCRKEYENPLNRRYHAQPICCPNCGPDIKLLDSKKDDLLSNIEAIKHTATKIKEGYIVAIKSLGGYHLVCDATNDNAVKILRQRKKRVSKPFAIMCKDINQVKTIAKLSKKEIDIITSKEKPITVVTKNDTSSLSSIIAPNIDVIGVFLPFTPLQYLLFNYLDTPLVATSANLSGEPIITNIDDLYNKLDFVFDFTLSYNRDIVNGCDDSVVQVVNDKISFLRVARGYAPKFFKLPKKSSRNILAVGANQKNTISICFEDMVIISPHIGDLDTLSSMEFFENSINILKKLYDYEPELIVCDKHPNYESTKWAKKQNLPLIQIQHHYAHILSTIAEYNLQKDVLAFAFDGTGFGDDGNIWGGEVFIANFQNYKRVKHFEYFKLLGGENSIKEIKKLGLSLLFDSYSLEEILNLDNPCVKSFEIAQIKQLHTIWQKGLNSPLCSSVGRLFDVVCSLSGLAQNCSYDGESGLQIEKHFNSSIDKFYSYEINNDKISLKKAIKQIVDEKDVELICTKFINTLCEIIIQISNDYPNLDIVLTGGVFQNKTLLQKVTNKLDNLNKKYYYSQTVPLNDGGISFGQIYSQI